MKPSLGAARELLQAAFHTSSVLLDERDPARGSRILPTAWALSGKTRRNRLAHVYNGNSAGHEGESNLDEVNRKIRQVEDACMHKFVLWKLLVWQQRGLQRERR
uniref:Uncharacterized protein n=1 Tax=Chromera velia CCMP2878 TaxID=1169474 RepID=A0A0G4HDM1_9ALVE|eukprot:Cvel_26544.t1-p1 / transcript=Cvel_26544.t1 / gene=Cvel_26544 / organism=Chromera_velia_CCMP2878 / gene_product=hypothetical protein / transcript_product=hypothetical protein / location=Cvel_scaffold3175:15208-16667(-) / protein_length=103 / sequence_SO=supercontig / SO=protein_coding / is_pseudo=false